MICTTNVTGAERIFDGHGNLQRAVERAAATWDPQTLLVGGESAGGFGAASNFAFVRDYFPKARAVLVDDSGPVIDDKALAPCLQAKLREVMCACVVTSVTHISLPHGPRSELKA